MRVLSYTQGFVGDAIDKQYLTNRRRDWHPILNKMETGSIWYSTDQRIGDAIDIRYSASLQKVRVKRWSTNHWRCDWYSTNRRRRNWYSTNRWRRDRYSRDQRRRDRYSRGQRRRDQYSILNRQRRDCYPILNEPPEKRWSDPLDTQQMETRSIFDSQQSCKQ